MKHMFPAYPAGVGGVALLLLRASAAAGLLSVYSPGVAASMLLTTLAIAVVLGVATRVAASFGAVIALFVLGDGAIDLPHVTSFLDAAALALIGPGALSIDAIRFGRKTIHFPG